MLVALVCVVMIENLLKSISPINHYASFYHTWNHLLTKCIYNKVFIAFGFILLHSIIALSMLLCSFVHNLYLRHIPCDILLLKYQHCICLQRYTFQCTKYIYKPDFLDVFCITRCFIAEYIFYI